VKASRLRAAPAHVFVVVAVLGVALAASPRFADQFTSVKWYVLEAISAAWLLAELRHLRTWPIASRRVTLAVAALAALVVAGSLRHGPAWAQDPLAARAAFAFAALASLSYFRRTGASLGPLRAAAGFVAAVVVVIGFLQLAGRNPLPWLTAGDSVSATFGNVNMAAQAVALCLLIVLAGAREIGGPGRSRLVLVLVVVLAVAGLTYLYVLAARSVLLAVAGALVVLLLVEGKRTIVALAAAAALTVAAVRLLPGTSGPPQSGGTSELKRESVRLRLAVWSDTLRLLRDHPLGVGAGNFEQAFIPYALGGRTRPGESLVFRSPHNEYLRLLAEEGLVGAALLLGLVAALGLALHRRAAFGGWQSPPGRLVAAVAAFLAIEAFFQFPFEMAFPALVAAVTLGLAGSAWSTPDDSRSSIAWRVTVLAAVALTTVAVVRVARADLLQATGKDDADALGEACRLDPRRLEACVQGAWLRIGAGDRDDARRVLADVLVRAPHYFPAIKLLGEEAMAEGDVEAGCFYLGRYDALFDGKSGLHERVAADCPPGRGGSRP
jgi:O-antigen ligase